MLSKVWRGKNPTNLSLKFLYLHSLTGCLLFLHFSGINEFMLNFVSIPIALILTSLNLGNNWKKFLSFAEVLSVSWRPHCIAFVSVNAWHLLVVFSVLSPCCGRNNKCGSDCCTGFPTAAVPGCPCECCWPKGVWLGSFFPSVSSYWGSVNFHS